MCETDILFLFWYSDIIARKRSVFSEKAFILFFQSFKELYVCTTIACFKLYLIARTNECFLILHFSQTFMFLRYCIELCLISNFLPCDVFQFYFCLNGLSVHLLWHICYFEYWFLFWIFLFTYFGKVLFGHSAL